MPSPAHDLESFYAFGRNKLAVDGDLTLDDLYIEWDAAHRRDDANEAIREGIADVDAGRTRPAAEVIERLRERNGLSSP